MAANNPMARFAVVAPNPFSGVLQQKKRQGIREASRALPKNLNDLLRNALGAKLLGGQAPPEEAVAANGAGIGGAQVMLGTPVNEEQVMLRDRREKMRGALLQRIREDRAQQPDAYARAERMYQEDADKRGKFLRKAYDAVGTPEGYSDFDLAIMRSQGLVNPLLDEYSPVTRERVAREFQKTHKWARKKENLADLDIAVKYLMSRPDFQQSFYYNP